MLRDEIVDRALVLVAEGGGNYEYFFSHLKSPDWIGPLLTRGRFSHPPEAESDGTYVRFPAWPEGEYLLRMAPLNPDAVFGALDKRCFQSSNHTVHQLLLQIAANLPIPLAVTIVNAEAQWVASQPLLHDFYSDRSVPAILHIAAGEHSKTALSLAEAILDLRPPKQSEKAETDIADQPIRFSVQPLARLQSWEIQRFAHKIAEPLSVSAPTATLALFSRKLDKALLIRDNNRGNDEDFSTIWRPRIDSDSFQDLLDVLVTAVRDTALLVSRGSEHGYESVREVFQKHNWPIFRRLEFHILSETESLPLDLVGDLITAADRYKSSSTNPEFTAFLSKSIGLVSPEVLAQVLNVIDSGPDLSQYSNYLSEQTDEQEKARKWFRDKWRLGWLTAVREALTGVHLEELDLLTAEYGAPRPSFSMGSVQAFGHVSTMSLDQMRKMPISEVVAYLRSWNPPPWAHPESPSRGGIGQTLQSWASDDPASVAEYLSFFLQPDLHPTYVRSLIDALTGSLKSEKVFDVYQVVKAIEWVLTNSVVTDSETNDWSEDPGWSWAHMSAARFLTELFLHPERLEVSRHQELWPALELISRDLSPTDADESEYRKEPERFVTLALNSARPVGLEAIMMYARWLKVTVGDSINAVSLPQAFRELARHLDPEIDGSVAVREMYGMQFSLLAWLDRSWLEQQLPSLFPGKAHKLHDRFAWASFLRFNPPMVELLPALRFRYEKAIRDLDSIATEVSDTDRALGNHLMRYYAFGTIDLSDSLLSEFFDRASTAVRAQTVGDIGWHLGREEGLLSATLQQRLMEFWEARLATGKKRVKESKEELGSFGWWFASGKFPDSWAIQQAVSVLDEFRSLDPDFAVVRRLAEVAQEFPFEAVHCLGILFEEDKNGWSVHGWGESPQLIIEQALRHDERSRTEAIRVANVFVSHGHQQYRNYGDPQFSYL